MNIDFRNAIREFSGVRVICGDDFIVEKSKNVEVNFLLYITFSDFFEITQLPENLY